MTGLADPRGLRLGPLARHLGERLDGFDACAGLHARLLTDGRSNVTYVLNERWVLRRPPLGNVMPSAHDMGREHRVLSGLTRAGFPVPRPLHLCSDETVIGAPFMIAELVEGRVLEVGSALAQIERDAFCTAFVDTLADLHAIDPAACGLQDLGRPYGFLQRQVRRWTAQWQRTKTRELPVLDELIMTLAKQVADVPEGLSWGIVHGDFRLDNLILDDARPEIRAVVDWEMSTLGHPAADLAVSLVYWTEPTDVLRKELSVAAGATDAEGFWNRRRIVERYSAQTGDGLEHLDVCLALACLKLAVIMESIHKRTLDGHQIGERVGDMARGAEALARMGVAVARGGGLDALAR
jgi:aminoglycoside phosphotransferase (APT) family kinase protein